MLCVTAMDVLPKPTALNPAHTLYDDERLTEQRVEELKTLLKFEKPDKTIIQFRFINKPDDGTVLRNHLATRNTEKSDSLASLLQATNLALYEEAIRSGEIKMQAATVWIRVPTKHLDDSGFFVQGFAFPSPRNKIRRYLAVSFFARNFRQKRFRPGVFDAGNKSRKLLPPIGTESFSSL